MKHLMIAALAILTLLLGGCGNDYTTVYTEVNTIDGVTLTLKEDTLKSSKATFILTNNSDAEILLDPVEFHLEEWKNDTWVENIGTRVSEWKRDTTEAIPAGESIEKTVDWKGLCGAIGSGEHRIILIANDEPIACEFNK